MTQGLAYLKETPSQTAGPYVHIGMAPSVAGVQGVYDDPGQIIAGPDVPGERIRIEGCVLDGDGAALRDALIEVWQADANGIYNSPVDPRRSSCTPGFIGWGRIAADLDSGEFAIDTIRPGAVPGPTGSIMAPHICFWIVARGINLGLSTRLYFPEERVANSQDPVLLRIENVTRRETLIASPLDTAGDTKRYRFDIRLQGANETVFFAT